MTRRSLSYWRWRFTFEWNLIARRLSRKFRTAAALQGWATRRVKG